MNRDCIVCKSSEDTLMIGAVEGGSGSGRTLFACLTHARTYAQDPRAPKWLVDNVAKREAELAGQVEAQ